ncbi:hypothetical protein [Methylocella sp.]|uniref:hypothetical protein n=1 Tax=Methylocella sp. TaxID=1978226 RepID=UPI0035AF137C
MKRLEYEQGLRRHGRPTRGLTYGTDYVTGKTVVRQIVSNVTDDEDGLVYATFDLEDWIELQAVYGMSTFICEFDRKTGEPKNLAAASKTIRKLRGSAKVDLARTVDGTPIEFSLKHINGDIFDCRRTNLRRVRRWSEATMRRRALAKGQDRAR